MIMASGQRAMGGERLVKAVTDEYYTVLRVKAVITRCSPVCAVRDAGLEQAPL